MRLFRRSISAGIVGLVCALSVLLSPSTVAAQQTHVWKIAEPIPEKSWFGNLHKWWAQEVEKRSKGQIKVQFYWANSLVKWADALPGIQSGIADMAWVSSTYYPTQFPNYLMLDNVFNFGDNYVAALKAAIDTIENQPDVKAEIKKADIVFLMPHISGHAPVGTKNKLNSVKELSGKSLRTYGGVRVDYYKSLGANPIFMPFNDMYQAIDRGTIDALGDMAIVLSNAFKLNEVVNHVHYVNPPGAGGNGGALASGLFVSGKKFRALSPDLQKMLIDLRMEYAVKYGQTLMDDEAGVRAAWAKSNNIQFHKSSPADAIFIKKGGDAANDVMFKKQENQGFKNVRKVWDYFLKARQKYEAS